MRDDERAADANPYLGTSRLEAFSDGVFSIAITLLVLEIALRPPGSPLEQVLHAWPSYLAYVVSFLTIGAAWISHAEFTDGLQRADSVLLRLNLLVLLVVAFLPFPTKITAESLHRSHGEPVYVAFYGLTLLAIRLLGFALDEYGRREQLLTPAAAARQRRSEHGLLRIVVGYAIAIAVGCIFPTVGIAAYFAIAVYLVVPFGAIARALFGRA